MADQPFSSSISGILENEDARGIASEELMLELIEHHKRTGGPGGNLKGDLEMLGGKFGQLAQDRAQPGDHDERARSREEWVEACRPLFDPAKTHIFDVSQLMLGLALLDPGVFGVFRDTGTLQRLVLEVLAGLKPYESPAA